MKIVKSTEAITVDHPVFLIFGRPGICKTSLGYSAPDPLLWDFDKGAHRAVNRKDTLVIDTWNDVTEAMDDTEALSAYKTSVVDTVGRALDVLTVDILAKVPKAGTNGNLSLQGYGHLKSGFKTWINRMRSLGQDVLLISHDKEDKKGDDVIVRPDIVGGSLGEVMRLADFVGYLYMDGKQRTLDFSPTSEWVGKNPAQWKPFAVPPAAKAGSFMAELMAEGRLALGRISEGSAKVTIAVETFRVLLDGLTTGEQLTTAIPEAAKLEPAAAATQAKHLIMARAEAIGVKFDTKTKTFVPDPAKAAAAVTE